MQGEYEKMAKYTLAVNEIKELQDYNKRNGSGLWEMLCRAQKIYCRLGRGSEVENMSEKALLLSLQQLHNIQHSLALVGSEQTPLASTYFFPLQ